jgi:hypothetical protein
MHDSSAPDGGVSQAVRASVLLFGSVITQLSVIGQRYQARVVRPPGDCLTRAGPTVAR